VTISGQGHNALDFHIAYYLGLLSSSESNARFYIVSKDTGFDPLIKHLKDKCAGIQRVKDLGEIPAFRMSGSKTTDEKIDHIVKNLAGRGPSRPRKVKTLQNTIRSLFKNQLDEGELQTLVKELVKRRHIILDKDNVRYNLPRPK
jgi:hypothetical protein